MIYIVRFWNNEVRKFRATNLPQAQHIATGLARSNGWVVKTIGKA